MRHKQRKYLYNAVLASALLVFSLAFISASAFAQTGTAANITNLTDCPQLSPPLKREGCVYTPVYDNNRCIAGYVEICATNKTLTVVSPNGGERWETGKPHQILWNSSGFKASDMANIYLLDTRYGTAGFIKSVRNTGNFSFEVPRSVGSLSGGKLGGESAYKIRLVLNTRAGIKTDESDAPFSITAANGTNNQAVASVTLLSPNGGERLEQGNTYEIKWSSSNIPSSVSIVIDLYRTDGREPDKELFSRISNDGSENWTIPDNLSVGSYKVRIYCWPMSGVQTCAGDYSDASFDILAKNSSSLKVLSPNGGETWEKRSRQVITWSAPSSIREVNITLTSSPCNGPVCPMSPPPIFYRIANRTENDGIFEWTVPEDIPREVRGYGNTYRIMVTDSLGREGDISDSAFAIQSRPVCMLTGCSSQLCVDASKPPVFTTCEWLPQYACYQKFGKCEPQKDGACGWTQTAELMACISGNTEYCGTGSSNEGCYCNEWENKIQIPSKCPEGLACPAVITYACQTKGKYTEVKVPSNFTLLQGETALVSGEINNVAITLKEAKIIRYGESRVAAIGYASISVTVTPLCKEWQKCGATTETYGMYSDSGGKVYIEDLALRLANVDSSGRAVFEIIRKEGGDKPIKIIIEPDKTRYGMNEKVILYATVTSKAKAGIGLLDAIIEKPDKTTTVIRMQPISGGGSGGGGSSTVQAEFYTKFSAVFMGTDITGEYTAFAASDDRSSVSEKAGFVVYDKSLLGKFVITENIGNYDFVQADVRKATDQGRDAVIYTAQYSLKGEYATAGVFEFESSQAAAETFSSLFDGARLKIGGETVALKEGIASWPSKNFIIGVKKEYTTTGGNAAFPESSLSQQKATSYAAAITGKVISAKTPKNMGKLGYLLLVRNSSEATKELLANLSLSLSEFRDEFYVATDNLGTIDTSGAIRVLQVNDNMLYIRSDGIVNGIKFEDVLKKFYSAYPNEYDFVFIFTGFPLENSAEFYNPVQNNINGIGLRIFNRSSEYGSGKLKGLGLMTVGDGYPPDPAPPKKNITFNETIGTSHIRGPQIHEIAHQWCCFAGDEFNQTAKLGLRLGSHLYPGLSSPWNPVHSYSEVWVSNNDGTYRMVAVNLTGPEKYHPFMLYFMGLLPESEYEKKYPLYDAGPNGASVHRATFIRNVSVKDIIAFEGERSERSEQTENPCPVLSLPNPYSCDGKWYPKYDKNNCIIDYECKKPEYCGAGTANANCACSENEKKEEYFPPCPEGLACEQVQMYRCVPEKEKCDWRPVKDYGQCKKIIGAYYDGASCVNLGGCEGDETIPFANTAACNAICETKKSDLPMPIIEAYLKKYPSDLDKKKVEIEITTEKLLDIVFRLENMKKNFDELQRKAQSLSEYYKSTGDQKSADKFSDAARLFSSAKDKIDQIKAGIRSNIDNPDAALEQVKQGVEELRKMLRNILLILLDAGETQPAQARG